MLVCLEHVMFNNSNYNNNNNNNVDPVARSVYRLSYRLDGPGIESRWGEIFRPSRLALRPIQPPLQRYRVFPGGKVRPERAADHSPPSSAVVMEEESYTSTHPLGHNRACNGNTLPFYL